MKQKFTLEKYYYSVGSGTTKCDEHEEFSAIDGFFQEVQNIITDSFLVRKPIEIFHYTKAIKAEGKKLQIFYASKEDIKSFGSDPKFQTQPGCSPRDCFFIYQNNIEGEDNLTLEEFKRQFQKRFPDQTTNKIPSTTLTQKQKITTPHSEQPKPSSARSEEKNNALDTLKNLLTTYIKRVESYKGDYASGFWFFSASRAINREANYRLAKYLLEKIDTNIDIATLFSDKNIKTIRSSLIEKHGLNKSPDYVERGLNSEELNNIIKQAHLFFPTDKVINPVSRALHQKQ